MPCPTSKRQRALRRNKTLIFEQSCASSVHIHSQIIAVCAAYTRIKSGTSMLCRGLRIYLLIRLDRIVPILLVLQRRGRGYKKVASQHNFFNQLASNVNTLKLVSKFKCLESLTRRGLSEAMLVKSDSVGGIKT
jgi:hypothetical protein